MFAIGEAETKVVLSKVALPREYNLRRNNRKIFCAWLGDKCLFLSDEEKPLLAKTGRDGVVRPIVIDSYNRISVPSSLNGAKVKIQGCITSIELDFISH